MVPFPHGRRSAILSDPQVRKSGTLTDVRHWPRRFALWNIRKISSLPPKPSPHDIEPTKVISATNSGRFFSLLGIGPHEIEDFEHHCRATNLDVTRSKRNEIRFADPGSLSEFILPISLPVAIGIAAWLVKGKSKRSLSIHLLERRPNGTIRELSIHASNQTEDEISAQIIKHFNISPRSE